MISRYLHRIITGIIFCLCLKHIAYCQQLQFERFTTADGLPSDHVYTIHMDHKGYIWACTNNGIVKYNGNAFISVCKNISPKEDLPYCMFQNSNGELWFTNSKANVFKIRNDSAFQIEGFETFSKELAEKAWDVGNMMVDDSLNIFLSTITGNSFKLIHSDNYRPLDLKMHLYYKSDKLDFVVLHDQGHSLVIKDYAECLNDRNRFTYRIMNGNIISEKFSVEIRNKECVRMVKQSGNSLYITAANELIKTGPEGQNFNLTFRQYILMLTTDKEGNIWLGMDQEGLYKISPEGKILSHYFPETSVNCILFDDQSGLWISTAGQGVFHCKNVNNYAFQGYPGLTKSLGLSKQIDSVLFLGTYSGELYQVGSTGIPKAIDLNSMAKNMIGDIIRVSDGYFIAGKDAILKTDRSFKNIKKVTNSKDKPVTAIALSENTKGELFGLARRSLIKIDDARSKNLYDIKYKAYCMIDYKDGNLLIGTSKGIFLFANDSLSVPPYLECLRDIFITKLRRSPDGSIWICTIAHGLYRLQNDNKITIYPEMPARVLHDILFLNDSTIGLCFNNGTFISPFNKLRNSKEWYQLNNEESSAPVLFNDRLYISTNSGLLSFSMDHLLEKDRSKLYFTKAVTADSIYENQLLFFRHDQEKIEFYFDLLNYKTKQARLVYTLKGKVNEKDTVDGTKITLNKLPPGNYTLSVASATSSLQISEKTITLSFTIEPAFWQTTSFFISAITFIILWLIFIIYIVTRRTKIKERQKAEVTRLLAEYKLTALKAQINPHFISNALSAIQQLILDGKADKAAQYLAKFSLLIRYVLKYSDKSIVKLSEELEVIDLNIQLEMLRFKDDFEIQKKIAPDIDPENINVPPLITQPFVENAIWHGLLPLKGKRKPKLIIAISKINSDIMISIEDNGAGRNSEKNAQRESQGTQLIANRLENINLLLGTKTAKLEIEDLYDSKGETTGTRVNIILPGKFNNSEYDEN